MKKMLLFLLLCILTLGSRNIFAQAGTYYDAISISSSSFITDLQTRIRTPYTKISYDNFDETNVANFAARDTTGGQKVVTCVYSGQNYVYSPPFAWGTFSREHTWCHSWMPSWPAESRQEYSDQHHLFPTNQNNANGVRSNHPVGIVSSVTSSYLLSKYGTNASGQIVFEPRGSHKGDLARALLYMSVRYNGVDGNNWTFNYLNNTTLPALSEDPQDLNLLLQWHRDDPPDAREVLRNNYIQSVQGNRNPFVDHPEYVGYIDFSTLSKLNPSYSAEPENYVTNFTVSASTANSLTVSWTNAVSGSQAPSGYLLEIFPADNYYIPIDGSVYSDDINLTDARGTVNIANSGTTSYQFTGLTAGVTYYVRIFSYNGTGSSINYKINGTIPSASGTASPAPLAAAPSNYASGFSAGAPGSGSIQISWTDAAAGSQAPSGYLLQINTTGVFTAPVNGTAYSNGSSIINIAYPSSGTYTVTGLSAGTHYYFRLYSYNGTGTERCYKTDGTVPSADAATTGTSPSGTLAANDILITHYSPRYSTANDEFIVLFNNTNSSVDLNGYEIAYSSSGGATSTKYTFSSSTIIAARAHLLMASSATVTVGTVSGKAADVVFTNGFADAGQCALRKTSGGTVICAVATGSITAYSFGQSTARTPTTSSSTPGMFRLTASGNSYTRTGNNNSDYTLIVAGSITDIPNSAAVPLPVELTGFSAEQNGNGVVLKWSTASEINNFGFDIERMDINTWKKIGFVKGNGNSNSPKSYTFTDDNVKTGKYSYRLKQIDTDGKFEYSSEISITIVNSENILTASAFPNPFNNSTRIRYTLPFRGMVRLAVYSQLGELVDELVNAEQPEGVHNVSFESSSLSSGIYFYVIEYLSAEQNENIRLVNKIMLIK